MTTRDMKALRRGVIMIGLLFLVAGLVNARCDNEMRQLAVPHGR